MYGELSKIKNSMVLTKFIHYLITQHLYQSFSHGSTSVVSEEERLAAV
jgi:hypothetical protein